MVGLRFSKLRARIYERAGSGNVLVEYAFVMPAFIIGCFFCIQCVWFSFQVISFDYAANSMLTNINADDVRRQVQQGDDLNELMKSAFEQSGSPVDMTQLRISGMTVNFPDKYESKELSEHDRTAFSIKRVTHDRRYMDLSGTMSYTIKMLIPLPGFSGVQIVKTIAKTKLAESTFEVS